MNRDGLVELMLPLLRNAVDSEDPEAASGLDAESRLVGPRAVMSSLTFVSFIMDVETVLAESHGVEVTLVSEKALSQKNSPFKSLETLADYVLELSGDPEATR